MGKIAEPSGRKGRKLTPASDGNGNGNGRRKLHQQQQKKKGRPASRPEAPESETRRSLRQLRRREYYCDYYEDFDDDFVEDLALDDDEEDDEEQETKRKEKKINLVLKKAASSPGGPHHHLQHDLPAAAAVAADSSDCENREERHPLKKRRISGCGDANGNAAAADGVRSIRSGDEKERTEDGVEQAGTVSAPGSPSSESRAAATPLPDRKVLELILDKLQKKDTYGVYAEPVDPEELPDYHDVIANPMDFATVRKKLASGTYSSLEQLENDVFLICSNAMQYNAPDTIYFKQASAIQELARKKFDKLKADEIKSVQKTRTTFETEKPIKKHLTTLLEHGGSDFSLGATFTAPKVACAFPNNNNTRDGGVEKPVNGNVNTPATDGNCFSTEKQMDRLEDVLAKESPLKFGKKLSVLDENRRATYISNQPMVQTDCIFTTFESETKQLIAVGLHADHSYARSLARFAAALGPTAWAVASRKIEQALPAGCKFGRGWVGEYEPLPTPVLTLENRVQTQLPFKGVSCERAGLKKDRHMETTKVTENGGHKNLRLRLGSNLNASSDGACHMVPNATDESSTKRATLEGRPVLFGSPAGCQQPKKSRVVESAKHETSVLRQSDSSSSMNGNTVEVASRRLDHNPEVQSSGLLDIFSRKNSGGATLFKQPEMRLQGGQLPFQAGSSMGLPNGNSISSSDGVKTSQLSLDSGHKHPFGRPSFLIPNNSQQGLDDPVELIRKLSEKAAMGQPQLNPGNATNGVDVRIMPSAPFATKPENPSASAAAARAWMSIGPASPYTPIRENVIPVNVKSENKNFAALPASRAANISGEAQQHGRGSLMGFPQNMDADSPRFQLKSHWHGRTNAQKGQRRDMLPPDLNIGFQGPGSPVRQSSGILVDSQQPDLALQL